MVLLLLMLLPTAFSTDSQSQKNFTIKHVDTCPEEGYFVHRELAPNSLGPGPCFLCFCQREGTANCWRRESWRCDVEKYHHHHVGKRDTRIRRGAMALGDIFFRDATRDVFNRNVPQQCKPFESSFSDGCPPVDWCIGCTVCDCDANGHWDCRVLSFCDKTTKKPVKKRKANYRRTVIRKATIKPKRKVTATVKPPAKPKPKVIRRVVKKPAYLNTRAKRQPQTRKNVHQSQRKDIHRNKAKKVIQKKQAPKKIIKKDVSKKPADVKEQIVLPTTPKFAQAVVQQVLAAVKQLMRQDVNKGSSSKILKELDKKNQGPKKQDKSALMKRFSHILRRGAKQIKGNTDNFNDMKNRARNKREVGENDGLEVISVAPVGKGNVASSDNIIPLHKAKTTTENPINIIMNLKVYNETPTTGSIFTIPLMPEHLSHNISTVIQTNYTTEKSVMYNSTTISSKKNYDRIETSTENTKTTEWKSVLVTAKDISDTKNVTTGTLIYLSSSMPEANDLKFDKWAQLKMLKEREKHFSIELFKSNNNNYLNISRNISLIESKPNIFTQNITRKINMPKNNILRKIIISPRMKKESANASFLNKKVNNLQNMFKNIIKEFSKNTTKIKSGRKKFNIVKYMRKLFGKLLRKGKTNTTRTNTEILLDKQHTINVLCENIAACNVNAKNRKVLDAKLALLSVETNKILKIMKIIKGLLRLLEIPMDNKSRNGIVKQKSNLNDDVNKLNIILRDTYFNDIKFKSLSQTQVAQIDYIKTNTKEFIHSVARFAKILNEIIAILKESNKLIKKRKVNKLEEGQYSNSDAFRRLRSLLIRYDVMQNSYFKKIYDSLTAFETKLTKEKQKRNSLDSELKNMATIDNFSRNIISNLRQLTQLAQSMNSRSKRETKKDNDAVEYLLMLMEYLLKQNYSLDAAPVNDGIDLLIEAIKNAPNTKPIKKKVLQYIPAMIPTRTVTPKVKNIKEKNMATTTTVKKNVQVTTRLDDPKFVEPVEEERDYDDKYLYTRRAVDSTDEEVTNSKVSTASTKTDLFEDVKDSDSEGISESKVDKFGASDGNEEKFETSEIKMEKTSTKESFEEKRFDIFNADLSDVIMFITSSSPPSNEVAVASTTTEATTISSNNDRSTNYATKAIEWIDQTYDKDVKNVKEENKLESTRPPVPVTRTKKGTSKVEENVSAITKEVTITDDKKKSTPSDRERTSTEEVIYKKQMDLLNSLDYPTEKAEFDMESKEAEEPFPVYFV